jgi:glucosamine 6-phosphate synthetase-like amidotransferase/phosphosugar isomerase protein
MWAEIRDVFTKNLLHNEQRGKIATGAAIVQKDGTFDRFKIPVPATEFVNHVEYRHILNMLSEETVCLLGHTREPTKGDPQNNLNNHPLIIEHHIGVHNGKIHNDTELFAEYGFPRLGEVDSEIIFRLFNQVAPGHPAYAQELARQASRLEGTFATISVDLRDPCRLVVIKHKKPLSLHYHAPWQALVFSSRYVFLRRAFGRAVITEALDSGKLLYFHARQILTNQYRPVETYALFEPQKPPAPAMAATPHTADDRPSAAG